MTSYSWTTAVSGDWNTGVDWSPATVPNAAAADVTIDALTTLGTYTVTIAAGESELINSLALNVANNLLGTNSSPYTGADIEIDGTLAFAPGSTGRISGSLQTVMVINGGTIVNGGSIDAFIQAQGNVLFTGTNGIYITNWLQALAGTVTIDTSSIAEMTGNTLFDGIFEAKGSNATVNLGGPLEHLIVNIATIEGPPTIPEGWTELLLNDPTSVIQEWNGTAYVPLEATLVDIKSRATLDVLAGRNYATTNTLAIDGGMLNLQAGTFTAAGLDINSGVVQGYATIVGPVVNNGTLIALNGTLDLTGSLTGTGAVDFDIDVHQGTVSAVGATLEVAAVSAGQIITMNGDDTLILTTPSAFAGTIAAKAGDKIVLLGQTLTSAVDNAGTLVVSNGTQTVASLKLAGSYAGDVFATSGSTITITGAVLAPTITGTVAGQVTTTAQTIAPFAGVVIGDQNVAQTETVTVTLSTPGNGTFSNLGGGTYNAATGVYTDTGTAAAVTAALDGLIFAPVANGAVTGSKVTTGFKIVDTDTAGVSTTNTTTSVVASVVAATTIEANGATALVQVGNGFVMNPTAGGTGVTLMYKGTPALSGGFSGWVPIAAEKTATGYEVAWKLPSTGQFIVWNTDATGNFVNDATAVVSGTDTGLETLETSFQQDLNGDGHIGPTTTTIEADGATTLVQVGNQFQMNPTAGGTGVTLMYKGTPALSGGFSGWVPIAAEKTATGYEVAWKLPSTGQFIVWNTDATGNFVNDATAVVSGTDTGLETLETSFQQDLNGDGHIGPTTTTIEANGATTLVQVGNQFQMNPTAGGTGVTLMYKGTPALSGGFSGWVPIAAEKTATGYEVAWKLPSTGQFIVWNTDATGNFVNDATTVVSGTDTGLETLETSFQQDLNGDGHIGPTTTMIEANGATTLVQVGNQFQMNPTAGGTGVTLMYKGTPALSGGFSGWVPIGAAQTSTGFQVAWNLPSTGQFIVWNTDGTGAFTSNATAVVSGQDFGVEDLEPSFHQDLNGDGRLSTVLVTATSTGGTLDLTGSAQVTTVNLGTNTASASFGLNAPSLTFIGTPDAITLGSTAATIEYTLAPGSGVETIANFSLGLDELNISLVGAANGVLKAYDTTVGGVKAIAIASSADPAHGLVLLNVPGTETAAILMASHVTFTGGHALLN